VPSERLDTRPGLAQCVLRGHQYFALPTREILWSAYLFVSYLNAFTKSWKKDSRQHHGQTNTALSLRHNRAQRSKKFDCLLLSYTAYRGCRLGDAHCHWHLRALGTSHGIALHVTRCPAYQTGNSKAVFGREQLSVCNRKVKECRVA
jgi:hypothetical protein